MGTQQDILGTIHLAEQIKKLESTITGLLQDNDPFADLVPEAEFSERVKVSASTLRQWRKEGVVKDCWIKRGKHIWWSPRKFRDEISKT